MPAVAVPSLITTLATTTSFPVVHFPSYSPLWAFISPPLIHSWRCSSSDDRNGSSDVHACLRKLSDSRGWRGAGARHELLIDYKMNPLWSSTNAPFLSVQLFSALGQCILYL